MCGVCLCSLTGHFYPVWIEHCFYLFSGDGYLTERNNWLWCWRGQTSGKIQFLLGGLAVSRVSSWARLSQWTNLSRNWLNTLRCYGLHVKKTIMNLRWWVQCSLHDIKLEIQHRSIFHSLYKPSICFNFYFNCFVQESMRALADMRRSAKEKELNALLSGDNDYCSCFIEVYFLYHLTPSISLCL